MVEAHPGVPEPTKPPPSQAAVEEPKEPLLACVTCRFYVSHGPEEEGKCRRHAPQPIPWGIMQLTAIMASALWQGAAESGLVPCAVEDLEKGDIFDPAGNWRHTHLWPSVYEDDLCGEYEKAEGEG